MAWIVEIGYKNGFTDPVGFLIKKEIEDLGIKGVEVVKAFSTYRISGRVSEEEIKKICEELLVDKQIQEYGYSNGKVDKLLKKEFPNAWLIEVNFKRGVTDAVGASTTHAIEILGIDSVREVRTGNKYLIIGNISEDDVKLICKRCLANELIQKYTYRKLGGN